MQERDVEKQSREFLDAFIGGASDGRTLSPSEQFRLLLTANRLIIERLAQIGLAEVATEELTEAISNVDADKIFINEILNELSGRIPKDKLAHAFILGVIHSSE